MPDSMRDRILAAAVSVLRERGVSQTTTKEIARTAGVAEGSIYNHFAGKTELMAACMADMAGGIRAAMVRLSGRVGEGSVDDNLIELAEAQIAFHLDLLPITGPALGDRELRERLRDPGPEAGGYCEPLFGHAMLTAYLEAEQRAGRLAGYVRPAYLAATIIGACHQYAFVRLLSTPEAMAELGGLPADPAEYAREVVRVVMMGHHPRRARPR